VLLNIKRRPASRLEHAWLWSTHGKKNVKKTLVDDLTMGRELIWLDMSINVNKSCCMRIHPPFDVNCCSIITVSGHSLPWTEEFKYSGIIIVNARILRCSFDHAKRAYYRSLKAIFGRAGTSASEEVVFKLSQVNVNQY
jgi:hypothetical protein